MKLWNSTQVKDRALKGLAVVIDNTVFDFTWFHHPGIHFLDSLNGRDVSTLFHAAHGNCSLMELGRYYQIGIIQENDLAVEGLKDLNKFPLRSSAPLSAPITNWHTVLLDTNSKFNSTGVLSTSFCSFFHR